MPSIFSNADTETYDDVISEINHPIYETITNKDYDVGVATDHDLQDDSSRAVNAR